MTSLVNYIAGQEAGTKSEHILFATGGRYAPEKMLKIGDAPGDLKAARDNDALFFPIVPGKEEQSWKRFFEEGSERFFNGTFAGASSRNCLRNSMPRCRTSSVAEINQPAPGNP